MGHLSALQTLLFVEGKIASGLTPSLLYSLWSLSNVVLRSMRSTENVEILRRTGQVILQLPCTVMLRDGGAFTRVELCRCEGCR